MATGSVTSQAIAYLKAALRDPTPGDLPERRLTLSGPDSPVLRVLTDGLVVAYVVDRGDQLEYIQERHLMSEDCSEEELHAVAVENLRQKATGMLQVATHPCGEMFAVMMGGIFEASLITLDDVWNGGFRQFVSGEYIIACPARDLLAFCDARSVAGIRELQIVCASARAHGVDHPISDRLYRRVGDRWEVFEVEPGAAPDGCR